jgi:hypothetical protein
LSPFIDVLERDVCTTADEFVRGLRLAFPDGVDGGPDTFIIADNGVAMRLTLTPLPSRRIASLELPMLHVSIRFTAGDPHRQRALLDHMDRATQRGGG